MYLFTVQYVICPHNYIHIISFTTAAKHKLWISTSSHEVGLYMHTCQFSFSVYHLLSTSSSLPTFLSHLFSPLSRCPSFLSYPKEERLYNNSRHDSMTLTLHKLELEVLRSLWCESHKSERSALHWGTWWCWRCVRDKSWQECRNNCEDGCNQSEDKLTVVGESLLSFFMTKNTPEKNLILFQWWLSFKETQS